MRAEILLLLFCICCRKPAMEIATPPIDPEPSPKTWLALGDSYTIGQGVLEKERFPAQTALWLNQNGQSIITPDYIATTGWTIGTLTNNILAQNPPDHDIVSLLIGVNDQYQTHDTTGYRQKFTYLLEKAIKLARGKKENVFVLSIPDYSVTPFAIYYDTAQIRREIDWFNSINKDIASRYKCPYLDITPSTREARTNRILLASDGLHPSGIEYKRWADKLGPLILEAIR